MDYSQCHSGSASHIWRQKSIVSVDIVTSLIPALPSGTADAASHGHALRRGYGLFPAAPNTHHHEKKPKSGHCSINVLCIYLIHMLLLDLLSPGYHVKL